MSDLDKLVSKIVSSTMKWVTIGMTISAIIGFLMGLVISWMVKG